MKSVSKLDSLATRKTGGSASLNERDFSLTEYGTLTTTLKPVPATSFVDENSTTFKIDMVILWKTSFIDWMYLFGTLCKLNGPESENITS